MKVLVTQNRRGIGDLIIFIPYIFYISEKLSTPVSLLVRKSCKASEILSKDKRVNEIIILDRDDKKKSGRHHGFFGIFNLIKDLKKKNFDRSYTFNSSARYAFIMKMSGIKQNYQYPLGEKKNQHIVKTAQKFIYKNFNSEIDPTAILNPNKLSVEIAKKKYLFNDGAFHILLGIGGSGPTKRIPIETYLSFIELISKKNNCKFYLGAGQNEVEQKLIDRILESKFKGICVSLNKMTIADAIPVIKNCNLAICNDTSFSHISSALKIPTIVLMSDTPLIYGSYSSYMSPILPEGISEVTHNTFGREKINADEIFLKAQSILKIV